MNTDINTLIKSLHNAPAMAVLVIAGAGNQAINWLLSVPGASKTILECLVPYSSKSLTQFLGKNPKQTVSINTAENIAKSAYQRALVLRHDNYPIIGIGCTATIATDRPKRGEHRSHIATWNCNGMTVASLQFTKGYRDRLGEEDIVSKLILNSLAETSNIPERMLIDLNQDENIETKRVVYSDLIAALLSEHISSTTIHPDGQMVADERVKGGVLAGSFNPIHEGHQKLANCASKILGENVTYELSITNVDKPTLEESEIRKRIGQFSKNSTVTITRASVFSEKARLFPGCTFVIGWDTAVRLVNPRYYAESEIKMLNNLKEIDNLDCSFLVAGRMEDGVFHTLDDIAIPPTLIHMFSQIQENTFRHDLSSTELRHVYKNW